MTTDRDFDGIAMAWLADGPEELSDRVLAAVVDEIHLTRQRRPLRVPWRYQTMSTPLRAATAAVIGVLVIGGFVILTRPGQESVGGPSPSPSASPSATASGSGPVPALSQTFTSPRHGYTISYPADWTATPGTRSWVTGTQTLWGDPAIDSIGSAEARLSVASQPLAAGQTPDAWLVAYCRTPGTAGASCGPPIAIGDQTGYVDEDGGPAAGGTVVTGGVIFDAAVVAGGRGYEFTLDGHVSRALFDALLATVSFDPATANGFPVLSGTFKSTLYGYSIGAPRGWTTIPGTTAWVGTDDTPPMSDQLVATGSDTTILGTSQALPKGTTFDQWLTALHAAALTSVPTGCDGGDPSTWPVIPVGSESGRLQTLCNASAALVLVGGRVYEFDWTNSSFDAASHISRASWRELLDTAVFDPSGAS